MHKRTTQLLIIGLLSLLIAGTAFALSIPTVDWWVFGGVGARSIGGDIAINDTIGQSMIGSSTGGDITLEAGYWFSGIGTSPETHIFLPLVIR